MNKPLSPASTSFLSRTLLIAIALLFTTPAFGQVFEGDQEEIDKILRNVAQFSEYYVNGETEKLVNCYTEDGKVFPGRRDIIEGQEGLRKYWMPREGSKVLRHKINPVEIRVVENTAYDYGYYEGTSQNAEGENRDFKGKYVIVWHKVGEDWKIYLDIWNGLPD